MIHRMDPPQDERAGAAARAAGADARAHRPAAARRRPLGVTRSSGTACARSASREGGRLRLASRNGRDITPRYPELRELGRALGSREALLDGEVVAFGEDGRPSFQRLQRRMHLASESVVRRLARTEPVVYVIFDLLHLDGRSLLDEPYAERRARLAELDLNGPAWQTPAHHVGDGAALLEASRAQGLEGVIAKRLDCPYTPGPPLARLGEGQERPARRRRHRRLAAGRGEPLGPPRRAARGLPRRRRPALRRPRRHGLRRRRARPPREACSSRSRATTSPFAGRQPPKATRFVEPRLVCAVEYTEWTQAGTLRHPSYKGLRDDVAPEDVICEEEMA